MNDELACRKSFVARIKNSSRQSVKKWGFSCHALQRRWEDYSDGWDAAIEWLEVKDGQE